MKLYEFELGPNRPIRFPRKLKKRVIKEFGRDTYNLCKIGYRVVRKYRPPQTITKDGWRDMPQNSKLIGKLQILYVIWDAPKSEVDNYEKNITRKSR